MIIKDPRIIRAMEADALSIYQRVAQHRDNPSAVGMTKIQLAQFLQEQAVQLVEISKAIAEQLKTKDNEQN